MSITQLNIYPKLTRRQRLLKWLVGGQDLVAIVTVNNYDDGRSIVTTTWLGGVDVRKPIEVNGRSTGTSVTLSPL